MVAMEELQKLLSEAEARISEGELLRRKLHNTILVCCLLRWNWHFMNFNRDANLES